MTSIATKLGFLTLAGLMGATVLTPSPAEAKACLATKINIKNDSGATVKLFKVYFTDQNGRPRAENIPNVRVPAGGTYRTRSAMRKIGGKSFALQVSFKKETTRRSGAIKLGKLSRTPLQAQGICRSGGSYTITIR